MTRKNRENTNSTRKKSVLLRSFKRAVITGFIGLGLCRLMAPDVDYDDNQDYVPTEEQQHFLTAISSQNHTVALGDTDHRKAEIHIFAYSSEIMGVLEETGKKKFFIESGPGVQPYYDALYEGYEDRDSRYSYKYADGNMWLCSESAKQRLNETFEKSARSHDIRFIAADMRHSGEDPRQNLPAGTKIQMNLLFYGPIGLYRAIHGCVDTPALIFPSLMLWATGGTDILMKSLTDDEPTANHILKHPEPAAILYGAGHYNQKSDTGDKPLDMISLLRDSGRSVAVIGIYHDQEQRDADASKIHNAFDAVFYVNPPAQLPHGIDVINPDYRDELKKILDLQEVKSVAVPNPSSPGSPSV